VLKAALRDSGAGGLDDPCDLYLPRLGPWGVTIRYLLRMCSGSPRTREATPTDGMSGAGPGHGDRRSASSLSLLLTTHIDEVEQPKRKKPGLSAGLPLSSAKSPVTEIRS